MFFKSFYLLLNVFIELEFNDWLGGLIQLIIVLNKLEYVVHHCLLRDAKVTSVEPSNVVEDLDCFLRLGVLHEQISRAFWHNYEEEQAC